jgi:hypothetical protein
MPNLFIANTSTKHNDFNFRLPGNPQLRIEKIPAGNQIRVLADMNQEEIDYVVKQHEVYGLIHVSQIKKIDQFSGMIYSDKPISVNDMQVTMDKNNDVLLKEGYELKKVAAVAMDSALRDAINNSHENLGLQKSVEIDIQEIPQERTDKRSMYKQKIKVAKE